MKWTTGVLNRKLKNSHESTDENIFWFEWYNIICEKLIYWKFFFEKELLMIRSIKLLKYFSKYFHYNYNFIQLRGVNKMKIDIFSTLWFTMIKFQNTALSSNQKFNFLSFSCNETNLINRIISFFNQSLINSSLSAERVLLLILIYVFYLFVQLNLPIVDLTHQSECNVKILWWFMVLTKRIRYIIMHRYFLRNYTSVELEM